MQKLCLILLFFASSMGCAFAASSSIELSSLNARYAKSQPVELQVKNVSSGPIRVYAYLECQDKNGQWENWPYQIENGVLDAISHIYKLKARDSARIVFDIRKITLPPIPKGKKANKVDAQLFRFTVVVLDAKRDTETYQQTSPTFLIIKPYE